jgi:hypothetical protein
VEVTIYKEVLYGWDVDLTRSWIRHSGCANVSFARDWRTPEVN